jgi:hypothetical protein
MLAARRGKKRVLPQGVAHQAARSVFLVGVKNRLMPCELAASLLPTFSATKQRFQLQVSDSVLMNFFVATELVTKLVYKYS